MIDQVSSPSTLLAPERCRRWATQSLTKFFAVTTVRTGLRSWPWPHGGSADGYDKGRNVISLERAKLLMQETGWGMPAATDDRRVGVRPMGGWAWFGDGPWCAASANSDKAAQLRAVPNAEYCWTLTASRREKPLGRSGEWRWCGLVHMAPLRYTQPDALLPA